MYLTNIPHLNNSTVLICSLFNDAVSTSNYMESDRIINK